MRGSMNEPGVQTGMEGQVIRDGQILNRCPVDLRPLPPVRMSTEEEIRSAVARARAAQGAWVEMGFEKRAQLMKKAGKLLLQRRQEARELIYEEAGKTPAEVLLSEAIGPLQYISDWVKVARPWLKPRKLAINPLAFPKKSGVIEMLPRGV